MSTVVRWHAPDLNVPLAPPTPAEPALELIETIRAAPAEPAAPPIQLPTLEEVQAIRDAAQEEGFQQGHVEGYAQGQNEVRRLVAQIEGILDNFSRPLGRLENEVVGALGDLSVRIAGALIGRAYESDPELLVALVHDALDTVSGTSRDVEVRLHPDDIAAISTLLSLPEGQRLVPDVNLSRGDLRVHAESVRIDGTLDARLRAALSTVLRRVGAGQ
ncbi:FliH/SctL family protein [Stenotrophomonas sp. SY1]|uniref:FliH/SctL family protein n=1 Tax=Stenotrophomonas sp. SY1 TaxID=477235 RepID=UPI001E509357|nr:FliH/SctL family protein [Stenotrophomonas sp. SY1]MCD9087156.1 flagellar assembly protein FliH [Stenotrophomonas sp. SY1]